MATLIKADGTEIAVQPKNGKDFKLEELKEFVKGFIEIVYPYESDRNIMVVNEEGKLNGLPFNKKATELYGYDDQIMGDVLLCKDWEVE